MKNSAGCNHFVQYHDASEPAPPLKRHQTLQPLSREHMGGLIQARNLQVAADKKAPARHRAIREFATLWQNEIMQHFEDEERLLMPLIDDPAMKDRLLNEHHALRQLARQCECDADSVAQNTEAMRSLGILLYDHIRWEERVLFETIQRTHPESLSQLLHESERIHDQRPGSRPRLKLNDTLSNPHH